MVPHERLDQIVSLQVAQLPCFSEQFSEFELARTLPLP